jgi:hypothetical protein
VLEMIDDILDRPEHEWFEAQKKLVADAPENTTAITADATTDSSEPQSKTPEEPVTVEN